MKNVANNTLIIINFAIDETDEEVLDYMRTMKKHREQGAGHIVILFEPPKKSSREIYQFPQIRATCRRLVRAGFISYLTPHTTLPEDDEDLSRAYGALEVWLTAQNRMRKRLELPIEELQRFQDELMESNQRADAAIGPMILPEMN